MKRRLWNIVLLTCGFVMLFASLAHGQVTDRPITTLPQAWVGVVVDVQPNPLRACIAGWERSADRYGDHRLRTAFVDCGRLTTAQCTAVASAAAAGDLVAMMALRTANVGGDAALKPCIHKLKAPPLRWAVAPIASGKRPAYLLNGDGTRGKQSGTADVLLTDADGTTHGPQWCHCTVRSKESTSSTYCAFAMSWPPLNKGDPVTVTLCRATP